MFKKILIFTVAIGLLATAGVIYYNQRIAMKTYLSQRDKQMLSSIQFQ